MSLTFEYDTVSSVAYIDLIIERHKLITPPSIERSVYIPEKEGEYYFDRNFGKALLMIDTLIKGTSEANLLSKIKNLNKFLHKDEPKRLIFSDESDKHFNALFANKRQRIARRVWHARVSLEFICFDPFGYTTIADDDNQNCTTKPTTIPINNEGNYKACPIWIITFNQAQTYIKLYNDDNSEIINVTRALAIGSKLKIDTKNEIIYYDFGSGYSEDWQGVGVGGENRADFVKLKVGNKNYYITTTDTTLNINVAWEFNKTWL